MPNDIFVTLLNNRINSFINAFIYDSKSIFYKDTSPFHPGELGKYREKTFSELLKLFIPININVSDGFIITSKNNKSTQVDVIVYDPHEIPLLTNDVSCFYTVESVQIIGEIKSDMSKSDFRDALIKLSQNKSLQDDITSIEVNSKMVSIENNHIISFLVCKKLNFDLNNIDFNEIYADIKYEYRHNAILSIEDGTFLYNIVFNDMPSIMKNRFAQLGGNLNLTRIHEYPIHKENSEEYICPSKFIEAIPENQYAHIKHFLVAISSALRNKNRFSTEVLLYSDVPHGSIF